MQPALRSAVVLLHDSVCFQHCRSDFDAPVRLFAKDHGLHPVGVELVLFGRIGDGGFHRGSIRSISGPGSGVPGLGHIHDRFAGLDRCGLSVFDAHGLWTRTDDGAAGRRACRLPRIRHAGACKSHRNCFFRKPSRSRHRRHCCRIYIGKAGLAGGLLLYWHRQLAVHSGVVRFLS